MKEQIIRDRVAEVMSTLLKLSQNDIDNEVSPENVEDWDSLLHISLVLELEKEFGVKFLTGEVGDLINLNRITEIIEKKYIINNV